MEKKPGLSIKRHFTSSARQNPFIEITWEKRTASITGADGKIFFEQKDVEFPSFWSQQATNIVAQKYFRVVNGERERSVQQVIERVADTIANKGIEGRYFDSSESIRAFHDDLCYLLLNQYMAFNSPVWFNVGVNDKPQCSACFINSVEDSMESILDLAKTEGMLFKHGSGTGTNLSVLRAEGEPLKNGGTASGPVSFMKGFDSFAGAIKSGGASRRAAKLLCLDVDHPDIEKFIDCKADEEKKAWALIDAGYDGGFNVPGGAYDSVGYQNANHSVRVSDDFMRRAAEGGDWALYPRTDAYAAKKVPAKELFRKMAEAAHLCGDPGIQFDDTINSWHTCPNSGRINASNPCCFVGETLVRTSEGKITIERLAEMSEANETLPKALCFDFDNYLSATSSIKKAWKSGETKSLVKVTTSKGIEITCTPDHVFYLRNGNSVPAKHLIENFWLREQQVIKYDYSVDREDYVKRVEFIELDAPVSVYDLEVDVYHNFAVSSGDALHGLIVSNSEYMFLDDSACNLASLNLLKFLKDDGSFDIESYEHAIYISIIAMEIIVGFSSYPTEKIVKNSHDFRPLGLGYANLGALLMCKGLPYDSDEGRAYAACLTSILTGYAYYTSAIISRDATGPFAKYEENQCSFLKVIEKHNRAKTEIEWFESSHDLRNESNVVWSMAQAAGEEHGFRNSQATVLAPTGTIAFMMDCDTTGIEPELALVKYKTLVGGGNIKITNNSVIKALKSILDIHDQQYIADIEEYIEKNGTVEGCKFLFEEQLRIFDCALTPANGTRSIAPMGHIKMMAACQPFLSGAISKTANLPKDSTVEDIESIYMQAWKLGLKAVAVYRDGCKRTQPLSTSQDVKQGVKQGVKQQDLAWKKLENRDKEAIYKAAMERSREIKEGVEVSTPVVPVSASFPVSAAKLPVATRKRLPNDRQAITHKFQIGGHEGYITVGLYEDGTPGEIFVKMAKEGSVVAGLVDAFAISVSIGLQHGVPLSLLCDKFIGTRFEPSGFTGNSDVPIAASITDYLFKWLDNKFLKPKRKEALKELTRLTEEYGGYSDLQNLPKISGDDKADEFVEKLIQNKHAPSSKNPLAVDTSAPPCASCGGLMQRSGSCYRCMSCGDTSGCG